MKQKIEAIYKQLENNIITEFNPVEYKIAMEFFISNFTENELFNILKNLNGLTQVIKNKIQNAYRDIKNDLKIPEIPAWNNEQINKLQMLKRRNEI